jgi:hypothetical protein
LKALVGALLLERGSQKQRADDLNVEKLHLQVELARHKKSYRGLRADQLQTAGDLVQLLLGFAEALDRNPVNRDRTTAHGKQGSRHHAAMSRPS